MSDQNPKCRIRRTTVEPGTIGAVCGWAETQPRSNIFQLRIASTARANAARPSFGDFYEASDDPETGVDVDLSGYNVQAGFFIIRNKWEVAARLAELDPNDSIDNNEQEERGLALNYFWNKHNHKLQLDYRQLENKATNREDEEVRLQYQVIF